MDSLKIQKAVEKVFSLKTPITSKELGRFYDIDYDLRDIFVDIVFRAVDKIRTDAELRNVNVVISKAKTVEDVAGQCACVTDTKRKSSGNFGNVYVTPLAMCEKLKKAGFVPEAKKLYAVKISNLERAMTTGRLDGIQEMCRGRLDKCTAIRSWNREVRIAKEAGEMGVGPKVYASFICSSDKMPHVGVLISDALHKKASELSPKSLSKVKKEVPKLLKELHEAGILHGDAHMGNVMVDKKGKTYITDYGFAIKTDEMTQYDYEDFENLTDGREPINHNTTVRGIVARLVIDGVLK